MERLHLRVHGLVQGVGFRAFAIREARALGLTGSARNLADGSVEIVAEGGRGELERLAAAVRRGPTLARVERVDEHWSRGEPRDRGIDDP
ncbi:MAG TPA: acylphosphatase [Candidatus Eisenbacteria bacterium]